MKFLICGLGSIGMRHLKNLEFLGYDDIILYTTGKSSFPEYLEYIKKYKRFDDLDEALNDSPDVCMITNPTSLHVPTAIKAARKGCHLYIEKPVSHNLNGLEELNSILIENNLKSLVTYQFRYHPHIVLLKKLFQNNEYGRPLYVTTEWSEYLPDWHPWEDYKQGYSAKKNLGGGVLLTQIHPLNYLDMIFGSIEEIKVNKSSTMSLGIDVDDVADLLISFESGLSGHVHVDFLQKPRVHNMKIVTEQGRFEWDYHENKLNFKFNNGTLKSFENVGFERNDMFISMLTDFINSIKENSSARFDISKAIYELRLLLEEN